MLGPDKLRDETVRVSAREKVEDKVSLRMFSGVTGQFTDWTSKMPVSIIIVVLRGADASWLLVFERY